MFSATISRHAESGGRDDDDDLLFFSFVTTQGHSDMAAHDTQQ